MTERIKTLNIICTDKAQHGPTSLGNLTLEDGEKLGANDGPVGYGPIAEGGKRRAVAVDDYFRVHIRCPRCLREVQWTYDTARKVIDTLWDHNHDGGLASLDISSIR